MGISPQSIINEQILDKCDFLVGVFWKRIGTATDKYASGSVEEIEKHMKLNEYPLFRDIEADGIGEVVESQKTKDEI